MGTSGAAERAASRWLILGATGFLGRHIRAAALEQPGLARLVSISRHPPTEADGEWAPLDLAAGDGNELRAVIADLRPDVIVNASGVAAGNRAVMAVANVAAVANLLDALDETDLPVRLVHLGSAAEYGQPDRTGRPIDEETPARPLSDYGALKLAATQLVLGAAPPVEGVVLRVFNPLGAGMSDASLPGRAARRIRDATADGEAEIAMGPLNAHRDFVDARDVARAAVAAATAGGAARQVFNVGSGSATLVRDLVALIADCAGYAGTVTETGSASARSAGVDWQAADITRARTVLGWRPSYALRSSVEELWAAVGGASSGRTAALEPRRR